VIWALLGLVIVVVIVCAITAFFSLQSISESLSNAIRTLERVHANDGKRIDTILDRLMSKDFETFKTFQLAEESEAGGQEFPEGEAEVVLEVPGVSRAFGYEDLQAAANERQIIEEDFPVEEEQPA
jgi:hypothetical protein